MTRLQAVIIKEEKSAARKASKKNKSKRGRKPGQKNKAKNAGEKAKKIKKQKSEASNTVLPERPRRSAVNYSRDASLREGYEGLGDAKVPAETKVEDESTSKPEEVKAEMPNLKKRRASIANDLMVMPDDEDKFSRLKRRRASVATFSFKKVIPKKRDTVSLKKETLKESDKAVSLKNDTPKKNDSIETGSFKNDTASKSDATVSLKNDTPKKNDSIETVSFKNDDAHKSDATISLKNDTPKKRQTVSVKKETPKKSDAAVSKRNDTPKKRGSIETGPLKNNTPKKSDATTSLKKNTPKKRDAISLTKEIPKKSGAAVSNKNDTPKKMDSLETVSLTNDTANESDATGSFKNNTHKSDPQKRKASDVEKASPIKKRRMSTPALKSSETSENPATSLEVPPPKAKRGRPPKKRLSLDSGVCEKKSEKPTRLSIDSQITSTKPISPPSSQILPNGHSDPMVDPPEAPKKDSLTKPSEKTAAESDSSESSSDSAPLLKKRRSSASKKSLPSKFDFESDSSESCDSLNVGSIGKRRRGSSSLIHSHNHHSRVVFPDEVKVSAIERIFNGESQVEVARDLQCPTSTVATWWKRREGLVTRVKGAKQVRLVTLEVKEIRGLGLVTRVKGAKEVRIVTLEVKEIRGLGLVTRGMERENLCPEFLQSGSATLV